MYSCKLVTCRARTPLARRLVIAFWLIFFTLASFPQVARAQGRFTGHVISVEAGDRIVARLDTWNVTIQLHGISCPTDPQDTAEHARAYTMRRVLDSNVQVEVRGTGPHETIYGEVRTYDGKSLNAELVQVGLASWAKKYAPNRIDIARLELEAKSERRGIWGAADGLDVALPAAPPPTVPPITQRRRTQQIGRQAQAPTNVASSRPAHNSQLKRQETHAAESTLVPSSWSAQNSQPKAAKTYAASTPPPGLETALTTLRARGGRLQAKARRSAYRAPFLDSIYGSAGAAFLLSFAAQFSLAGGFRLRRAPFQIAVSAGVAIGAGLLAPLPYLLVSHMFRFGRGSFVSVLAPPAIALCAWSSVALCRREQILRAAPAVPLPNPTDQPNNLELVKIRGIASPIAAVGPFVSQVGRISSVYMKEITYSYDAVQSDTHYSARAKRGRRNTRYVWTIIHKETSEGDFMLLDSEGGSVLVDGARSSYMPQRVARFYNGVPVEAWFSRPYPGDTRTQIEFIGIDSVVVVWGRIRRTMSGSGDLPAFTITSAPHQNALIVETDEARIWSQRPIFGLLLTLMALALTLFLVYALSTPRAFASR